MPRKKPTKIREQQDKVTVVLMPGERPGVERRAEKAAAKGLSNYFRGLDGLLPRPPRGKRPKKKAVKP